MKFLADENISPVIVRELRRLKHNVFDIKEKGLKALSDREIAKIAAKANRIILTHDSGKVEAGSITRHFWRNLIFQDVETRTVSSVGRAFA